MKKIIGFAGIALLLSSCNAYWSNGKLYKYNVDKYEYEQSQQVNTAEEHSDELAKVNAKAIETETQTSLSTEMELREVPGFTADVSNDLSIPAEPVQDFENVTQPVPQDHINTTIINTISTMRPAASSSGSTPPIGTIILWALLIVLAIMLFALVDGALGGLLSAVLIVALIIWLLFYFGVIG